MKNAFIDARDILFLAVGAVILVDIVELVSKLFHMSEPATIGAPRTEKFYVKLVKGDNLYVMSLGNNK